MDCWSTFPAREAEGEKISNFYGAHFARAEEEEEEDLFSGGENKRARKAAAASAFAVLRRK